MRQMVGAVALAVLVSMSGAANTHAQESTVINVALLDMTAIFPSTGVWADVGPMGQGSFGMMGHGPAGMMGRGGFGPGMMGMMSIRTDAPATKAGTVAFEVTNWSRSLPHEMMVVAVDSSNASLPYDYATQQVIEEEVDLLAETAELEPNGRETLTLDLAPGSYLLICNIPGHYGLGMQESFTVIE